jgi:hypothetical protein
MRDRLDRLCPAAMTETDRAAGRGARMSAQRPAPSMPKLAVRCQRRRSRSAGARSREPATRAGRRNCRRSRVRARPARPAPPRAGSATGRCRASTRRRTTRYAAEDNRLPLAPGDWTWRDRQRSIAMPCERATVRQQRSAWCARARPTAVAVRVVRSTAVRAPADGGASRRCGQAAIVEPVRLIAGDARGCIRPPRRRLAPRSP